MAVAPIPTGPLLAAPYTGPVLARSTAPASQAQLQAAFNRGASRAAVKQQAGQGAPSLWDQLSSVVQGLPSGIVHLGVDAAKDIQGIGRTVKDAATGDLGNDATDYFPLLTGMGESFKETGKDIIHPSRFLQAAQEGRIVQKVLEDVGNAAIVLGPASKGLGAAAGTEAGIDAASRAPLLAKIAEATPESVKPMLAPVARGLERVVAPAERVASAPARVWTTPLKAVTGFDLPQRIFGTTEEGAPHQFGVVPALKSSGLVDRALATNVGQSAQEAAQAFRDRRAQARDVRENFLLPQSAEAHVAANLIDKALAPARKILGNDTELEHAQHLIRAGMAPVLESARRVAEQYPDQAETIWNRVFGREQKPTEHTVDTALAYANGTLDPVVRAKLDDAWQFEQKAIGKIEHAKLEGEGRQNPLSPAQLGDQPIPERIDYQMTRLRQRAEDIRSQLHGAPGSEDAGLLGDLAAARARVPDTAAADLVSETAQARARRAGALQGEQSLLARQADTADTQAARLGERASAAAARLGPEAVQRLLDNGVTGRLERQVPRAAAADERLAARQSAAEGARAALSARAERAQPPLEPVGEQWTPTEAPSLREASQQVRDVRARVRNTMVETRQGIERRLSDSGQIRVPEPGTPMRDLYDQIQGVLGEGTSSLRGRFRNLSLAVTDAESQPLFTRAARVRGVEGGIGLDEFLQAYADRIGGEPGTSVQSLLDDIRSIKDMKTAEASVVKHGFDGPAARAFAQDPSESAALVGSVEDAARAVIDAHHESVLPRPVEGPAPWEMTREQFTNEAQGAMDALHAAHAVPFTEWGPEQFAAENRLMDLIPESIGSAADLGVLHDRVLELARRAGYDVAHPPLGVSVEGVRGQAAVDAAHQRAQDAFDADQFNREMATEEHIPVNQAILQRPGLSTAEKALYDEMMAEHAATTRQGALEGARAQLVGGVRAGGEQAGRAVGQIEGKQAVLARQAEAAGGRVETLEPRIVQAEQSAQAAEAQGAGQALRFGERRGKRLRDVQTLEGQVRGAQRRLDWLEGERIPREEARLVEGPREVAPGKYVPALVHGERLHAAIGEMATGLRDATGDEVAASRLEGMLADVPSTMTALQARLDENPQYLPGAVDNPTRGGASVSGSGDQLPYSGRTPSERAKNYGHVPQKIRTVQRQLAREMSAVARNKTAQALQDQFARTGSDILGELLDQGELDHATYQGLMSGSFDRSIDLAAEMERRGYKGWDPNSPDGRLADSQVRADSHFLPKDIALQFQRWWKPGSTNPWLKAYDTATRGFKHSVLAMSPQWHIYNILGNTFMATFGAGETPATIARYAREATRGFKTEAETGEALYPPRLYGAGQAAEQARMAAEQTEPRTRFGRGLNRSYQFNETVDNIGRTAVYLAKKAKGYSDEEAVHLALQAMGDFSNLSPIEKNFVRRVVPFYAWAKHITQASYHLAADHPFRTAWLLHMSDLFNQQKDLQGLPGWVQDSVQLGGGWFLPLDGANPYSNSVGSLFTSPKDWPQQFFRSLNPLIKFGAQAVGLNVGNGRLNTRPPGSGTLDDYGRPMLSWESPQTLAYMAARMIPQGRLLTDLVQDPVVRYDTGEPVKSHGRTIPIAGGRGPLLVRDLGVPSPRYVDVQATRARIAKAQAAAAKSKASYYRASR